VSSVTKDSADMNIRQVELFLFQEAELIDRREYSQWLALFTDNCRYWIPLEEGQTDPKTKVSLVYDDRKLIETRIRRLEHPSMHAQAPHSRTLHIISNVIVEGQQADGALIVRSNQITTEYRNNHIRIFSGSVTHHLYSHGDSYQIGFKRIDLIDSEGDNRGIPIIL
jgi:benzoate/toluate 1,2-dioxygenase beta subunit